MIHDGLPENWGEKNPNQISNDNSKERVGMEIIEADFDQMHR